MACSQCEPSRKTLLRREVKEKHPVFNGATCLNCSYSEDDDSGIRRLICKRFDFPQPVKDDDNWCGEHPDIKAVMGTKKDTALQEIKLKEKK